MSRTTVPYGTSPVQSNTAFVLPSPIIECGNLSIFLDLLSPASTALLMPLRRRESFGNIEITLAAQVTAITNKPCDQAILTAIFLAAACTILGTTGSLLVPCEERGKPAEYVQQRARDLQNELLECLVARFSDHPSVVSVHHPARYAVPTAWVWRLASLAGSGIEFVKGHWSRPLPQADSDANPSGQPLA